MTTDSAGPQVKPERSAPSIEEIFQGSSPVHSADDLARDDAFDEGELEKSLADLSAMRHVDLI